MSESKVHIDVTILIRKKQRLYGVPNGEFLRYAQYCTRRIARLTKLLRKNPEVEGMKGPKFDLSPEKNQNLEHMEIVIYNAERAYARYRYLKNTAEGNARRNAHALRRLIKCQKLWQQAHDCAVAFCTQRTQLEIDAFQNNAKATLQLEKGEWANALDTFTQVSEVFTEIMNSSTDTTLKSYCNDIVNDIEPLLEFCRFNLGQSASTHINAELREKVRGMFSIDTEKTASVRRITELKWHGKTVSIVHDGLCHKLATVADLVEDSNREDIDYDFRMTIFDRLIAESHGVRQLVKSISQKSDSEDLRTIDYYLMWNSFIATIARSQLLLDSLTKPSERAEFASRTYSRIQEVKNQFDNDPAVMSLEMIWRALKVMNIALTKIGPESACLLDRASSYCGNAVSTITSENVTDPPYLRKYANDLLMKIRKAKIEAIVAMTNDKKNDGVEEKLFVEDTESFAPCKQLVEMPPKPRTITPKGMIFDLIGDYLEYPSLESKFKKSWANRLKFW
ncbi:signal recognition particle subunit SRP68-like [Histomonas meleagridis]|uniref:signal recognition particle subunit SRP68-like n=1 Tax=Histomonas meleagridis TaxID=135588 RepID=UPI00355A3EE4|nr:signal recognition particle subunit SRP68-like [Histomonas meleagridis]KAH0806542.1 signal recognition particle subunit SRP68-like [Histomonas meleagridis]